MTRNNVGKQVDPRSKMNAKGTAGMATAQTKSGGKAKKFNKGGSMANAKGVAGIEKGAAYRSGAGSSSATGQTTATAKRNAKASGRGFAKGGSTAPKGCGVAKRGYGKVRMS